MKSSYSLARASLDRKPEEIAVRSVVGHHCQAISGGVRVGRVGRTRTPSKNAASCFARLSVWWAFFFGLRSHDASVWWAFFFGLRSHEPNMWV